MSRIHAKAENVCSAVQYIYISRWQQQQQQEGGK